MALFENRSEAGKKLAERLEDYAGRSDVIVLALPRGGVPVAFQVAKALTVPLDVLLVRKLGVPGHKELAMGAIASGGVQVLNQMVVQTLNLSDEDIARVAGREQQELERRERIYRGDRSQLELQGRDVILVDDGLATGASMRAAIQALRAHDPAHILVAVPTAAPETCDELEDEVDEIVCATTPQPFRGVGAWYAEFPQVNDDEVRDLLERAADVVPIE